MGVRDKNDVLKTLLGAGLYLLDPLRDRFAGRMDDVADRAQSTYEEATDRLGRAGRAIRGEDSHMLGTVTALLVGVGIGVGLGMLFAPSSGEEIRNNLADRMQDVGDRVRGQAQEVGDKVRSKFTNERQTQGAGSNTGTGTYGQS